MKPLVLYECGICECYHPWDWDGDCREDGSRFASPEQYADGEVEVRSWQDRLDADASAGTQLPESPTADGSIVV